MKMKESAKSSHVDKKTDEQIAKIDEQLKDIDGKQDELAKEDT